MGTRPFGSTRSRGWMHERRRSVSRSAPRATAKSRNALGAVAMTVGSRMVDRTESERHVFDASGHGVGFPVGLTVGSHGRGEYQFGAEGLVSAPAGPGRRDSQHSQRRGRQLFGGGAHEGLPARGSLGDGGERR